MLAELLQGKTPEQARQLADDFRRMMHSEISPDDAELGDLEALEGVQKFPVRIKCAMLPWTTLLDALAAYEKGEHAAPSTTEDEKRGKRPNMLHSEVRKTR
jgi:nitrogen fixation NifU-like protein